jgi:hypothetical protein
MTVALICLPQSSVILSLSKDQPPEDCRDGVGRKPIKKPVIPSHHSAAKPPVAIRHSCEVKRSRRIVEGSVQPAFLPSRLPQEPRSQVCRPPQELGNAYVRATSVPATSPKGASHPQRLGKTLRSRQALLRANKPYFPCDFPPSGFVSNSISPFFATTSTRE